MKKLLFSFVFLLISYVGFSQKGISYQAVILDPNKVALAGEDISGQPLVNGDLWMKFNIYNGSTLQFEEIHKTKTDAYGLVSLLIGSVSPTAFNQMVWDANQKNMQVFASFNQGGSYIKVSEQKLVYTPYSLFSETAGKLGGTLAITGGGTGATTLAEARVNLGVDKVDNTPDAAKPISAATQAALDLKVNASDIASVLALNGNTPDITPALALKADLESPALSGVPTAPTASAGTNTTQIATTEYTNAAISSALSSTMFSVSTTLTSTITNPLGFDPSDNINYSGPLNVSTAQNLANGVDVLKVNQSGIANVGFGIANLYSNTTGNANTSVGYKGLYSNTSGKGNSAYGTYSLFNNTIGFSNTANGAQSLFSNTTGEENTANGKFALFSNIGGNLNTATGYQSLYTNTGNYNTAYGAQSLYFNTTGEGNTASGFQSLVFNTTGSYNTASGYFSLYFNSTGSQNTANGNAALNQNSTGEKNTANGYYALLRNTTGSENTAIGQSAGSYIADGNTANTTSDYSVYLGSNTKASADDAQNEVVIGYNAIGGGSNTVTLGNTSVTKVITSGAITAGAGTSSFAGPLVVGGTSAAPVASAALEVKSTTKGLLLPRLTTAQRDAVSNPEPGLLIYNSDVEKLQEFHGLKMGNDVVIGNAAVNVMNVSTPMPYEKSQLQTFTIDTPISLRSISLKFSSDDNTPTLITIYSYSGSINAANLAAGVLIGQSGADVNSGTITFRFNSPLNLAAGKYYFQVNAVQGNNIASIDLKESAYASEANIEATRSSFMDPYSYTINASKSLYFTLNYGGEWSNTGAASPALSGVPTAPTASAGTNTTQIATTEFTNTAISSALSSTLTHYIGESYGGGIVFYVYDNGKHGLIAATSDQSTGIRWRGGSSNTFIRAMANGVGAGLKNTAIIIANQGALDGNAFAATVCNEYSVTVNGVTYGDWYLPSKHELNLMFYNIGQGAPTPYTNIGNLATNIDYWTSTETGFAMAYSLHIGGGYGSWTDNPKSSSYYVRAIRAF